MSDVMQNVLLMSAVGSVLAFVILCIKPLTKRLFSPRWQYYIWLTVLIVMVLPIRLQLSGEQVHTTPIENTAVQTEQIITAQTQQEPIQPTVLEELSQTPDLPMPEISIDIVRILSFIWLSVAVFVLGYKITKYIMFLRVIKKNSVSDCSVGDIPKRLKVRKTNLLDAPLIVGLIKPVLYLPQTEIKEEDLNYIMLHELTHYRRHDLLYKWFAMLVSSIHWFNPFVYVVSKQIDEECEISCDYEVCKNLTDTQKRDYMVMILGFVQNSIRKKRLLTTQMASSKKTLERRFIMIRTKKSTSKLVSALSAVVAVAILSTTVFASGVLSGLTEDNYAIEILINGEKIEFTNKPFIENGEVYVPLREVIDKISIIKNEKNNIVWDNGKIEIHTEEYAFEGGENISIIDGHGMEIGINKIGDIGKYRTTYRPMPNAPILENSITYIPYSYLEDIMHGRYKKIQLNYIVYDKNGNMVDVSGYIDYNFEGDNFSIAIPESWSGMIKVETAINGDTKTYSFIHKAINEKYGEGTGCIFYIEKNKTGVSDIVPQKLIAERDGYYYVLGYPTDIQYPIWNDRDEEDVIIAEEYENMSKYIINIEKNFDTIIKFTPTINTGNQPFTNDEIASAQAVVEEYYRAKNARDKEAILSTVTSWYNAPNVVFWQDEIIKINNITYNPTDERREEYITNGRGAINNTSIENVIVLRVDYTVTNAENSAFSNGDYKNYAMILIRENKNSNWLIDDMGY